MDGWMDGWMDDIPLSLSGSIGVQDYWK
jgi:hypothetical protein